MPAPGCPCELVCLSAGQPVRFSAHGLHCYYSGPLPGVLISQLNLSGVVDVSNVLLNKQTYKYINIAH